MTQTQPDTRLFGVDFTSAPRPAKPILIASGQLRDGQLRVDGFEALHDWPAFECFLQRSGPWLAGLDLPFGLPAQLVHELGWPTHWATMTEHCSRLGKQAFRAALDAVREQRPVGARYLHRATDLPARSHSPMKLVNPPVGLMYFEGAPRLARAGLFIPGLQAGDVSRIAIEAYPGLLARRLGAGSYKSDNKRKQTAARANQRAKLLAAICGEANGLGFQVMLDTKLHAQALQDASGDTLDALLALCQAAWAWHRRADNYGLPPDINPLEGWIVGA